jgi:hypothetical protein
MSKQFSQLPVATRFSFYDQAFTKIARHLAQDTEGIQHLFDDETEVEPLDFHESNSPLTPQALGKN